MTLTGDHLAWQQRVFKETNATNKFIELGNRSVKSIGRYSMFIYENHIVFIKISDSRNIILLFINCITNHKLYLIYVIDEICSKCII